MAAKNHRQNPLQSVQEQEIVAYVEEKRKLAAKDPYEMQAYLNIAYYAGKQWVALNREQKRLFEPPKESWQIRYVANKIQPIVRTELAKITKNKVIMQVVPATNEDSDVKAARTAEKVVDWLEYELGLQGKDRELILWGLTTGIAFMKCYWNPGKGLYIPEAEAHLGDADMDVVSMFELEWDMSVSRWEDVRWYCHRKIRTVDYVKRVYGVEVEAEGGLIAANPYEAQLSKLNTLTEGFSHSPKKDSVEVKEFWELPCDKYPQGRRITVANGKVLYYEEDIGFGPQDDSPRELPFFPFCHINVPGRLVPTSVVEQLLPIQREYNKSRSQIIENKNLMANPIWIAPAGALAEDITNMPGGYYEYNPGLGKPELVEPPAMSADVYKNLDMCQEEFEFVSGQHETSHGQTPAGVTSGTAISYLQEQDDTKLGGTISNYIACKQRYMRYLLKMIQKKYDIERTVRIVGQNKQVDVVSFAGAELTSIDVRIQEASMYQLTRAAKQDWIIKLVQFGVLSPMTDKALIIKMLELGMTDDMYDEYETDVSQAQTENDKWRRGDPSPIVRDFYRHDVHVKEHNQFRKSDAYNAMPPEFQQTIDEHVAEHMQYAMQQILPQSEATLKYAESQQGQPSAQEVQTLGQVQAPAAPMPLQGTSTL